MTNNNHPIIPPPELFKQWEDDILNEQDNVDHVLDCAWKNGFQAGADQELEACVNYIDNNMSGNKAREFRAIRRPKPPSLKEQALAALATADGADHPVVCTVITADQHAIIRRALEQLDD